MDRRRFSKLSTLGLAAAALPVTATASRGGSSTVASGDQSAIPSDRGTWFVPARYGRFIHFGLYALLGRGEWQMYLEQIPVDQYAQLMHRFNPTEFSAREWVDLAKQAGQRYITITTKHHEGFAMFNTKLSDFSIMHSPYGRDLVGELAEECHRQNLVISFYFSLMDWHSKLYRPSLKHGTPVSQEFVDFMHGQVRELCTNYGKLGALWFDGGWDHTPQQWQSAKLISMIRKLQPDALINNRTGLAGDFSTPEEAIGEINKPGRLWENCNTTNDAWGYDAKDQRFKSTREITQLLVKAVAGDGNLLLNVGPLPSGKIDPVSTARLNEVGEWLQKNGESIYGATSFREIYYDNVYTTRKGDKVYVHMFDWKPGASCDLWQLNMWNAKRAYFLETGEPVKFSLSRIGVRLIATNSNPKPSPDTVIVFEGFEPTPKFGT
jgi:alpha-L-fucosidase